MKDPWFRGIDLITGNDGGVYIADWTDVGECHENDGVHRTSGRIYKVGFGKPAAPKIAGRQQTVERRPSEAAGACERLVSPRRPAGSCRSGWSRPSSAERERADGGTQLGRGFREEPSLRTKLRLHVVFSARAGLVDDEVALSGGSAASSEVLRVWAIRFLIDRGPAFAPSRADAGRDGGQRAQRTRAGLYLASALPQLAGRRTAGRRSTDLCLAPGLFGKTASSR